MGASTCKAIIDSGSSGIFLPSAYAWVYNCLAKGEVTESVRNAQPDIILKFSNGISLTIPPSKYYQPAQGKYYLLVEESSSVHGAVLGQVVMEQYYTIFDLDAQKIGYIE